MANDMENKAVDTQEQGEEKEFKEITLKFGKGLVGEPFTGKDGKDYKEIKIPNQDQNDKSPWASFVVRAKAVHEDKFGKGMWVKLPAEGSTTVRKDMVVGKDEAGKNIFETTKTKVTNKELKGMVEFYKNNDRDKDQSQETPKDALEDKPKASLKDKVEKNKEKVETQKKTKAAEKTKEKAPKAKSKGGNEL